MRKNLAIILACLSFMAISCNRNTSHDYMVVGYVAGYRNFDFSQINASSLTHINYAFANIINGEVMFGSEGIDNTDMNADDIKTLTALKSVNPDLRILVSVGGGGGPATSPMQPLLTLHEIASRRVPQGSSGNIPLTGLTLTGNTRIIRVPGIRTGLRMYTISH